MLTPSGLSRSKNCDLFTVTASPRRVKVVFSSLSFFFSLAVLFLSGHFFAVIYMGSVPRRWGIVRPFEEVLMTNA